MPVSFCLLYWLNKPGEYYSLNLVESKIVKRRPCNISMLFSPHTHFRKINVKLDLQHWYKGIHISFPFTKC